MTSGKVHSRSDMGREDAADGGADTVALGSGDADRGVRTLRAHAERRRADQLPDGVAGRRRTARSRNRVAGAPRAGSSPLGFASIPSRRLGRTADVVHEAQVDRTGWVGKQRLKVEVLLAAAGAPVPPPIDALLPDLGLRDEVAQDLPWLVRLLPRADVYLQDEVEIALHPPLTRVWSPKGRRRPRLVEAPG